jgi:hypothetical protein
LLTDDSFGNDPDFEGRLIQIAKDGTITLLNHWKERELLSGGKSTARRQRFDERNPGRTHRKKGDTKPSCSSSQAGISPDQKEEIRPTNGKTVECILGTTRHGINELTSCDTAHAGVLDDASGTVPRCSALPAERCGTFAERIKKKKKELKIKKNNDPIAPTDSPVGESSVEANEKSFSSHGKVNGKTKGALAGQREI